MKWISRFRVTGPRLVSECDWCPSPNPSKLPKQFGDDRLVRTGDESRITQTPESSGYRARRALNCSSDRSHAADGVGLVEQDERNLFIDFSSEEWRRFSASKVNGRTQLGIHEDAGKHEENTFAHVIEVNSTFAKTCLGIVGDPVRNNE